MSFGPSNANHLTNIITINCALGAGVTLLRHGPCDRLHASSSAADGGNAELVVEKWAGRPLFGGEHGGVGAAVR